MSTSDNVDDHQQQQQQQQQKQKQRDKKIEPTQGGNDDSSREESNFDVADLMAILKSVNQQMENQASDTAMLKVRSSPN
jgi:hypothetical protein